ncbi:UDP-N-acetylmuramyl-tripeptide synthetase [Candidatus Saccharibacteria bacterium]|nr:UDP-N-acetylmuramyl-tripeptide synthetase [Candidatus Saccharibacteria bacterium]
MNVRRIVKTFIPISLFKKIEPIGHLCEAVLFNILYGFPARNMKVIGVTGTNGKTTTTFMIHRMLQDAGYKTGLMTTVAYGAGEDIKPQIHHMTNVTVPELMKRLKWLKSQDIDWLVFEVTSQGLAQNRVWGVPFSVAVMTNITHEHLDYHGTFEKYRDAKKKLFSLADGNKKGLRTGIINAEDPSADLFAAAVENPVTYGEKAGDLRATKVKLTPAGSRYVVKTDEEEYHIQCHIPGSFNIANSLAVVAVGRVLDLSKEQIEKGIAATREVEGRMTRIDEGQDFDVIVDFAHTPDSFEKLFKDLRPVVRGKLIAMFGSAGRRDEAKRAVQGRLAGEYCDEIVITEEDDRDIDGMEIMNQIAEGAESAGKVRYKDLFLVHDRTEAIEFSLKRAKKGDTVILLGKGHEKTIERADGEHPWDEIHTTHKLLKIL